MTTENNVTRILEAFDKISRVFADVSGFVGDISLSKLELLTIEFISKQEKIIMSKLANNLRIRFNTATSLVDRLVQKKLVQRVRDKRDRRIVVVGLTDKGKKTVLLYQKRREKAMTEMMGVLSAEEQKTTIFIMEKLIKAKTKGEKL